MSSTLSTILSTLFPLLCISCKKPVQDGGLCSECWQQMHFIAEPYCVKCGLPFAHAMGEGAWCAACMQETPAFTEARSLCRYDDASKQALIAFKYNDKTSLAPLFGEWLARVAAPFEDKVDAIIPVPLHYWRLVQRRYNQSILLAATMAKHIHKPLPTNVLIRKRKTAQQTGLSKRQRQENLLGAFMVPELQRSSVEGKRLLLIDDVMTTGTTLSACSRVLRDNGAKDIVAITLARTVLAD